MILLVFLLLVILFPLTLYLLIVGLINRRRTALLVNGSWDSAGVVFAVSGFLLLAGPSTLGNLALRLRPLLPFRSDEVLAGDVISPATLLAILYFTTVAGGCALLIWWRRNVTAVYNVEPSTLEWSLAQALDGLPFPWKRSGNRITLFPHTPATATATPAGPAVVLDLEPFPLMNHVTLHWTGANRELRQQVESRLERFLETAPERDNAVAGVFLSLAGVLFSAMSMVLLVLIVLVTLGQR